MLSFSRQNKGVDFCPSSSYQIVSVPHFHFPFLTQLKNRILARGFFVKVERGVAHQRTLLALKRFQTTSTHGRGGESHYWSPLPPPPALEDSAPRIPHSSFPPQIAPQLHLNFTAQNHFTITPFLTLRGPHLDPPWASQIDLRSVPSRLLRCSFLKNTIFKI